MDSGISLDPHLVWRISRLSMQGLDSSTVFISKDQDKQLVDTLKKKFRLKKMDQGYEIDSITDKANAFATHLLSAKPLRKGRHNQVAVPFIELGSQCAQGTLYNWATYLQNEFFEECREAQEKSIVFHYAWLLIIIAMEAWRPPEGVQFPKVAAHEGHGVKYTNLAWRKTHQR